jgi:hypothetical protein
VAAKAKAALLAYWAKPNMPRGSRAAFAGNFLEKICFYAENL